MSSERTDVLIIGAGVVGLAIARSLCQGRSRREIVLVEKEDGFGRHTSSRNSEVIHAGFYYPSNSLKARLCVEGNPLVYEFCAAQNVPHRRCGKIVLGSSPDELEKIHTLYRQGLDNEVPGMRMLTRSQIAEMEPSVAGTEGLWSPSTGIFDTHQFMKRLEYDAMSAGVTVAYNCETTGIDHANGRYLVRNRDADGEALELDTGVVINAAGLWSDAIAAMAGIDVDSAGYRLHPCKGEYYGVASRHRNLLSHLVYPAPTAISLGVHAVLGLGGGLRLGPNAYYVDKIDYAINDTHHREFFEEARRYLPFIEPADLTPDMAGIRPKLQSGSEVFRDFVIREETDRGLPGLINLVGIESPGLTSSLAIADHVARIIGH